MWLQVQHDAHAARPALAAAVSEANWKSWPAAAELTTASDAATQGVPVRRCFAHDIVWFQLSD